VAYLAISSSKIITPTRHDSCVHFINIEKYLGEESAESNCEPEYY